MALYESGEDYLENILMLKKEKGTVRSIYSKIQGLSLWTKAG